MTWTRHGECNRCGYCCQFLGPVALVTKVNGDGRLDRAFWELRQPTSLSNREVRFLGHTQLRCSALSGENECTVYAERPKTCRDFPIHPDQIEETPCSHWFTDAQGETRGGQGSPHPTQSHLRVQP